MREEVVGDREDQARFEVVTGERAKQGAQRGDLRKV
jgi:hypothetical protein